MTRAIICLAAFLTGQNGQWQIAALFFVALILWALVRLKEQRHRRSL